MNRTPLISVRRELRREVGFGCPVPECGNPYLTWHHFDPPWNVRHHQHPAGMIALCAEHHAKADARAFTPAQLHDMKRDGTARAGAVAGRFDWMRHQVLAVAGGNFFLDVQSILVVHGKPIIWFTRDETGLLLVKLRMLSASGRARLDLRENYWIVRGGPTDFECPPHGRLIAAE